MMVKMVIIMFWLKGKILLLPSSVIVIMLKMNFWFLGSIATVGLINIVLLQCIRASNRKEPRRSVCLLK